MASNTQHHELDLPHFDKPVRLLIVVAPYYKVIADNLVAGARAVADKVGAVVDLVEVPGALEIPSAIGIAGRLANYDGFVALGCVIRGETTHYDTVCNDSSRGLTLLGLQGLAIGNGILTVENVGQAELRADPAGQNKGGGAMAAALHLVALARKWGGGQGKGSAPEERDLIRLAGKLEGPSRAMNKSDRQAQSRAARLYAVQALFQMEAAGQSADLVMGEFRSYRIGVTYNEGDHPEADDALFTRIVNDAVTWQSKIDQATDRGLVAKWPINRIDPVLRALFRAAGAEFSTAGTPPKVVISEYVRLAEAFFPEGREPKFVNAVLDHVARDLRPETFGSDG